VTRAELVGWDDPAVAALRGAQQAEIAALYGEPDPLWDMTGEGALAVVLLRDDDGAPVACGVLRDAPELGPATGELKRMFVVPAARGRGLSRRVLDELESAARTRGLARLVLETGPLQAAAIGLYLASGYVPTDRFPPYEDDETSRAFTKDLTVALPPRGNGDNGVDGLVVDRLAWTHDEAVALRRLVAETLRGFYGPVGWFADDEALAASDRAEAARALVVLVVRDGTEPVGTVTLSAAPECRPDDWGESERLLVLPAARGRGVARLMLREVEAEARAHAMTTLTLSTGYRQYPAMRLYLSSGYRTVAPVGEAWPTQGRLFWFAKSL
jgi:GNAT superfamily N-acetyltransferase